MQGWWTRLRRHDISTYPRHKTKNAGLLEAWSGLPFWSDTKDGASRDVDKCPSITVSVSNKHVNWANCKSTTLQLLSDIAAACFLQRITLAERWRTSVSPSKANRWEAPIGHLCTHRRT